MGAEIDRLEIVVETEANKANQQLELMIENLNKVAKSIGGINFGKLKGASESVKEAGKAAEDSENKTRVFSSSMSALALHTNTSNSSLNKFAVTLGGYIAKTTIATNRTKNFVRALGRAHNSFFPIIRGAREAGKAVESSMDYIETFNYFNVTMGKIGKDFAVSMGDSGKESAETYARNFSDTLNDLTKKMTGYKVGGNGVLSLSNDMNLGLDPNQLMNYQASIAAVTNSLGLCGETSINTSKALTMLAADLSSFKNVNLKTVMTNIQSGLIGQSRALYKYGIDITNATLQTYAYKYGLTAAVSEMTQADKMQLRLLAILDQSRIAWGDQANTINSVANQYRIMKQQIQNVARAIGNLLMPAIQAVLPFVNGLLIATQRLLGFIGGLLGIDFSKIMDGISSGYSGFDAGDMVEDTGNVADNFDKANEKAKKLQKTILGFDQINKLNDNTDTSNSGGGSAGGAGGAGGIDLSKEIGNALANYEAVWNEAFEKSVNDAQVYADRICAVFNNMWSLIKSGDFEGLGEYIAGGVNLVFEKINSVFNWDTMGPTITTFVNGYTTAINSLVDEVRWDNIGNTIGDGINVITNTMYLYLTGIDWVNLGVAFATGLNSIFDSVDWEILGQTVGAWFMKLPKILYGFVTNFEWDELGIGIGTGINGALLEIDGEMLAEGINGLVNGILTTLRNIIETVDWGDVAKTVGDVLGNLDWGTLASIGLAVGAVKLAGAFGSLFSNAMAEALTKLLGAKLELVFKGIGPKLTGLKESFTGLFQAGGLFGNVSTGAFVGVVAGIALIVAGIIDLWKTSETFRDNVKNMLGIIGAAFLDAKQQIWDEGLKPLWESIKEMFNSLYEVYESSGIKDAFEEIVTVLGYIASVAISAVIKALGGFVKHVAKFANGIIDTLNLLLSFVKSFIKKHEKMIDGWKKIFGGFTEFLAGVFSGDWKRAFSGIQKIASGFSDVISELFSGLWKKIQEIFSPFVEYFTEKFTNAKESILLIFSAVSPFFKKIWEEIQKIYADPKGYFSEKFTAAYNAVTSAFKNINQWFKEKWDSIKSIFDPKTVEKHFSDGFTKAAKAVKSAFSDIGTFFKGIANNIISPIGKAVNGVISGINWVLSKVGSKTRISAWQVPKFAKGSNGISKDTLGMVNDQKGSTYKELIVPPNGNAFIPEGRNVMMPLAKGTKIMPANQTKALMENAPHFAKGIGDFFGGAWAKLNNFTGNVMDYIANPSKILQIAFDKFIDVSGMFEPISSIAKGMVNKIFDSASNFVKKIFDSTGAAGLKKAVNWAIGIANDNRHGYDQAYRWGNPDYDCSALVISAFEKAGIKLKSAGATTTANLYNVAKRIGFSDITGSVNRSNAGGMKLGDILLSRGNHTALYIGGGRVVQASSNERGGIRGGIPGDQSGREIYTGSYYNYPWTDVLRYAKAYAGGGFPQKGELFLARERGPEMVGRIGNRNAVVNNNQITESVKQAVVSGMMDVFMATNGFNGGGNNQPQTIYIEVKTENDEVLARAVKRGNEKLDYRFEPVPV